MVSNINNQELIEEYKKLIERANGAETDWIDFKSEMYSNQDQSLDNLRTDVVAFGNYNGGIILIGVQKNYRTMTGFELKNTGIDPIKDRILDTLSNKIFPAIPRNKEEDIAIDHALLADGRYVVRITVKQFSQLRIVQLSDKRFSIPCRNNNRNTFLTLDQVDLTLKRKGSSYRTFSTISNEDRENLKKVRVQFHEAKEQIEILLSPGYGAKKKLDLYYQQKDFWDNFDEPKRFLIGIFGRGAARLFDEILDMRQHLELYIQQYIRTENLHHNTRVDLTSDLQKLFSYINGSANNWAFRKMEDIIQKLEELLTQIE